MTLYIQPASWFCCKAEEKIFELGKPEQRERHTSETDMLQVIL